MAASAYRDEQGVWVYPQVRMVNGKIISRERVAKWLTSDPYLRQAMALSEEVRELLKEVGREKCTVSYNRIDRLEQYYKPLITALVGREGKYEQLRTTQHYGALYRFIDAMLPCDEVDLYPDGVMENGAFSPYMQEKYGREYPTGE